MPYIRRIKNAAATLATAISFESTSTNHGKRDAACKYIAELLENYCGATVEYVETGGAPALLATIPGASTDSILYYGHYDVMDPGLKEEWNSDPFKLTTHNGRFYGRGAGDNKGQLLAVINGLNRFLLTHPRRCQTIQLLIEGEEEQGSFHLASTVQQLQLQQLQHVRKVLVVDGSMSVNGEHVLRLANRGLLGIKLRVSTADHPNHSGNAGNVISNPVLVFQQILNRLYDSKTGRVLIPGFYDGVTEPTLADWEAIDQLPFNEAKSAQVFGAEVLAKDKRDYYRRLMFKPTFNISGIQAGYNGPGMKTIIPNTLTASLNMRLVGQQNPKEIASRLVAELASVIDEGKLSYKITSSIPPANTHATSDEIALFRNAAKQVGVPLLIEPCMPGTVPNYVWTDILQAKAFTLPLANFDQNNHSSNENITQVAFTQGIALIEAIATEFENRS